MTEDIISVIIIHTKWTITERWIDSFVIVGTHSTMFPITGASNTSVITVDTNFDVRFNNFSISSNTWTICTSSVWLTIYAFIYGTIVTMWVYILTSDTSDMDTIIKEMIWADVTSWSTFSVFSTSDTVISVSFTSGTFEVTSVTDVTSLFIESGWTWTHFSSWVSNVFTGKTGINIRTSGTSIVTFFTFSEFSS